MSETNSGSQVIVFDYKQPATAYEFNKLLRGLIKPGVYSGGVCTFLSNTVSIAAFRAFFNVLDDTDISVHIVTTEAVTVPCVSTKEYVVMSYTWISTEQNWIDFSNKSLAELVTGDIILTKITYTGPNIASLDNTYKTIGMLNSDGDLIGSDGYEVASQKQAKAYAIALA